MAGIVDPSGYIEELLVEESCLEYDYTREILSRTRLPVKRVSSGDFASVKGSEFANMLRLGKKQLYLCNNKGAFYKECPGTKEYQCCEYNVLNVGSNCPIDCVYCILQAYLNTPWIQCYTNIHAMFEELDMVFRNSPERILRIGTGEFTDSLALDRLTGLSRYLVPYMGRSKKGILELKTKSGVIDNLAGLDHNGRTVVAWSLNSRMVMERCEFRASDLGQRLEAAQRCGEWGYSLAFHFDPIVEHQGWKQGYRETIEELFHHIDPQKIAWISLGGLRFIPALKGIGQQRFPKTEIYSGEFVTGLDGKTRYFRKVRVEMYKHLLEMLQKYVSSDTCVYFCMESDEVWREVFGFTPQEYGGLGRMLDRAIETIGGFASGQQ